MPQTNDLIVGLDPTGYTNITGAQLAQLVNSATPESDRGFIIVSTDTGINPNVPDASTATGTPAWQRYIWLRISATSAIPYVWNPTGANTIDSISQVSMLKWQSVAQSSIGNGVITNKMIADYTIEDAKIVGLSYSKLSGAPIGLLPTGAADGDLTGNYPAPSIKTVSGSKIVDGTITSEKLAVAGINLDRMAPVDLVAKDMARVNAGATAMEAFTPPSIFTDANVVTTVNALKIPQVATAGAGDTGTWQMQTVAQLLAQVTYNYTAAATIAVNVATTHAHGLGAVPSYIRAVLVQTNAVADLGYAQNMEVDMASAFCDGLDNTLHFQKYPVGALYCDATNVTFLTASSFSISIRLPTVGTGVYANIDPTKWKVKVYARL